METRMRRIRDGQWEGRQLEFEDDRPDESPMGVCVMASADVMATWPWPA
jgi:hypothetical protein